MYKKQEQRRRHKEKAFRKIGRSRNNDKLKQSLQMQSKIAG
jgi:hypothetical protein